jgi:hypothetical protein
VTPSPEEVKKILDDPARSRALYQFLRTEFSQENWRFLMAVRQLDPARYGPVTDPVIPPTVAFRDSADWIYDTFIPQGSPEQVNISHFYLTALTQCRTAGLLLADDFNDAYVEVQAIVSRDGLSRFLKTPAGQA